MNESQISINFTLENIVMKAIGITVLVGVIILFSACCSCKWKKGEEIDLTTLEKPVEKPTPEVDQKPEKPFTTIDNLQGTWKLLEMGRRDVSSFKSSIKFADDKVALKSGCNTMVNIITLIGNEQNSLSFDISKSNSTMIGCPADHIEQDLFRQIAQIHRAEVMKDQLIMTTASGDKLVYKKRK